MTFSSFVLFESSLNQTHKYTKLMNLHTFKRTSMRHTNGTLHGRHRWVIIFFFRTKQQQLQRQRKQTNKKKLTLWNISFNGNSWPFWKCVLIFRWIFKFICLPNGTFSHMPSNFVACCCYNYYYSIAQKWESARFCSIRFTFEIDTRFFTYCIVRTANKWMNIFIYFFKFESKK